MRRRRPRDLQPALRTRGMTPPHATFAALTLVRGPRNDVPSGQPGTVPTRRSSSSSAPSSPRPSAADAASSRAPCRRSASRSRWITTHDLQAVAHLGVGRGRGPAGRTPGPALDRPVRPQLAVRHRDRRAVRTASGRGAGRLPAGHHLQRGLCRRPLGVDRGALAAGRLHDRQRHRRPDGVALGPGTRQAVHAAHLDPGSAVHPPGPRSSTRCGPRDHEAGWLGVAKIALGWPLQIAAFAAMALGAGPQPAPRSSASDPAS